MGSWPGEGAAVAKARQDRASPAESPRRAGLVLTALILVAAVANLNLLVASVALPAIGRAFNAGQTELNLIAVSFSLGLAASVLYLGAIGDRHGRKLMLIGGTALSVPACLVAAWAPSVPVLIAGRFAGGLAAGMSYPTTLALITALWSGPARTRAIALWSALGGAIVVSGPLLAGLVLGRFWWGSSFLLTLPLAAVALAMAWILVPGHVNESSGKVDHLGGVTSVIMIAALIALINFAVVPGSGTVVIGLGIVTLLALIAFVTRQRRTLFPLYDLRIAGRRTFWVAACAGVIVFGSLMGGIFIGQQFVQNVLGLLDAGVRAVGHSRRGADGAGRA